MSEIKERIEKEFEENLSDAIVELFIEDICEDYDKAKETIIRKLSYGSSETKLEKMGSHLDEIIEDYIESKAKEEISDAINGVIGTLSEDNFKQLAVENYIDRFVSEASDYDEESRNDELLEICDYIRKNNLYSLINEKRKALHDAVYSKAYANMSETVKSILDEAKNDSNDDVDSIPNIMAEAASKVNYVDAVIESNRKDEEDAIKDGYTGEELEKIKRYNSELEDIVINVKENEKEIFSKVGINKLSSIQFDEISDDIMDYSVEEDIQDALNESGSYPIKKEDVVDYLKKSEFFKKIADEFRNYINEDRILVLLTSGIDEQPKKHL